MLIFSQTSGLLKKFGYCARLARAITLPQTTEKLQHDVYNICSGKPTQYRDLAEAVQGAVPNFKVDLPPRRFLFPPFPLMETKRLREDWILIRVRHTVGHQGLCWLAEGWEPKVGAEGNLILGSTREA